MSAAAQVFDERHCPNCRRMKPAEEFRSHCYCTECKRTYNQSRYAKMQDGTWKPKTVAERAPPRPRLVERVPDPVVEVQQTVYVAVAAVTTPAQEARLEAAMEAFMLEFGFTTLRVVYTRLEGSIGRKHRLELAREGWIA